MTPASLKVIKIDGIDVKFACSAALPRMYRVKFGRDIIKDMNKMSENRDNENGRKLTEREKTPELLDIAEEFGLDVNEIEVSFDELSDVNTEIMENVAYIMAKHADPTITDNVSEWLSQFGMFSLINAFPKIIHMWVHGMRTSSEPKKN